MWGEAVSHNWFSNSKNLLSTDIAWSTFLCGCPGVASWLYETGSGPKHVNELVQGFAEQTHIWINNTRKDKLNVHSLSFPIQAIIIQMDLKGLYSLAHLYNVLMCITSPATESQPLTNWNMASVQQHVAANCSMAGAEHSKHLQLKQLREQQEGEFKLHSVYLERTCNMRWLMEKNTWDVSDQWAGWAWSWASLRRWHC